MGIRFLKTGGGSSSSGDYIGNLPEGMRSLDIRYCIKEIPEIDTSNVTMMNGAFTYCLQVPTIPQLDTSKIVNFSDAFYYCNALTNEGLNNVLAMLKNAVVYKGTKTLKYIGLSETQATTCTTLSNWAACQAAGWSTGY